MKKTVIAVVGPTAVGKTSLSIFLAKHLQGEIISGDSMQVYKGMDIGTAKIRKEEMEGIPHHLLDMKNPAEEYSAASYKADVEKTIEEITARNRLPILVGGSGLYIQAALFDYNFPDIPRDEYRTRELEQEAKEEGISRIYRRLEEVDPEQAKKIHPNNHRRVIRALEIYETTGKTKTAWEREQKKEPKYNTLFIGLEMERTALYEQINKRVDMMMEEGLLEEVTTLYRAGYQDTQAMKAIGYKEFIPYLEGKEDLHKAIEKLKQNSRRYAKRQFTWFRNQLPVKWFPITPEQKSEKFTMILQKIAGILKMK
ncbi:tRNA (adenosine(37)-N6)-dimethylallyltransferase MiaA [Oceanobacillus alkalisoli]|uniref:tRNA (adenosine(37)-N6)-dimethylallyltransferase MiaA n=1 Tax=Oceanobacillus alkalisoli TaxID=2925113 RepID=UPI001EE3A442|nr:tRNA (adenosine(37)-N6)-dimethylallyltransferase MiaA [Oceanobacillus alkalisoli]MCG5103415.1 tRNA (adenosine(37)-N6)-dimethylallyltransferase MiaA [Oceanobacillus alkalisoli]